MFSSVIEYSQNKNHVEVAKNIGNALINKKNNHIILAIILTFKFNNWGYIGLLLLISTVSIIQPNK